MTYGRFNVERHLTFFIYFLKNMPQKYLLHMIPPVRTHSHLQSVLQ